MENRIYLDVSSVMLNGTVVEFAYDAKRHQHYIDIDEKSLKKYTFGISGASAEDKKKVAKFQARLEDFAILHDIGK